MTVDPEVEGGEGGHVDDSEAVGAARNERQGSIFIETHRRGD